MSSHIARTRSLLRSIPTSCTSNSSRPLAVLRSPISQLSFSHSPTSNPNRVRANFSSSAPTRNLQQPRSATSTSSRIQPSTLDPADVGVPKAEKVWGSADEAIRDLKSGSLVLSAGESSGSSRLSSDVEMGRVKYSRRVPLSFHCNEVSEREKRETRSWLTQIFLSSLHPFYFFPIIEYSPFVTRKRPTTSTTSTTSITPTEINENELGFGLCGVPQTLINAIRANEKIQDLTVVSNNAGNSGNGGLCESPVFRLWCLAVLCCGLGFVITGVGM